MNWRRGLFRGWVALSAIWIVLAALVAYFSWPVAEPVWPQSPTQEQIEAGQNQCFKLHEKNPSLGNPFNCYDADPTTEVAGPVLQPPSRDEIADHVKAFAAIGLLPPLILLALVAIGGWVAGGFRRTS